jgi:hypothetical protein
MGGSAKWEAIQSSHFMKIMNYPSISIIATNRLAVHEQNFTRKDRNRYQKLVMLAVRSFIHSRSRFKVSLMVRDMKGGCLSPFDHAVLNGYIAFVPVTNINTTWEYDQAVNQEGVDCDEARV